jgi:hypothetical protein
MLKGSAFANVVDDNEVALEMVLRNIYSSAAGILGNHPLYAYFERYLGGCLLVMEPDGSVLTAGRDDSLTHCWQIGYVHPLERDRYYQGALVKAQRLLGNADISSYRWKSEEAGAIKIPEGVIFAFSGFEFLELNEKQQSDDYRDIFETINLYTLLTYDFFNPKKQAKLNPYRVHLDNDDDQANPLREEIIFTLSSDELIEIAGRIVDQGYFFNFGLLNEIFVTKLLLEMGFIDIPFVERIIQISNNRFVNEGLFDIPAAVGNPHDRRRIQ